MDKCAIEKTLTRGCEHSHDFFFFFFCLHIYFQSSGILPKHLNRGHTEGSSSWGPHLLRCLAGNFYCEMITVYVSRNSRHGFAKPTPGEETDPHSSFFVPQQCWNRARIGRCVPLWMRGQKYYHNQSIVGMVEKPIAAIYVPSLHMYVPAVKNAGQLVIYILLAKWSVSRTPDSAWWTHKLSRRHNGLQR